MNHRLFIAATIFLTDVLCLEAEPNASLLFFFSPESKIEFTGVQNQPKRHGLGKEVMQQITQAYPEGMLLRGGERVFDLRIKAMTDGNITAFAFENQRMEDGKLQGYYPAALEELKVDERNLLQGKTILSGAECSRLHQSGVDLKAGREYRVQVKIRLASEHERQLGLAEASANGVKYLLVSAFGEPARAIDIKLTRVSVAGGVKVTRLDSLCKLETFADCYENAVLKLEKDAGGAVFLVEFE